MKVLAEYVMAGPKQASIACFGLGFVPVFGPWLSSAALVLVLLQLGLNQAVKVLPWVLLPGLFWLALGDPGNLMLLFASMLGAIVLGSTRSLSNALITVVCVSAMSFLLMQLLLPNSLEPLNKVMNEALAGSPGMEKLLEQGETQQQSAQVVEQIGDEKLGEAKFGEIEEKVSQTIALLTHLAFAWASGLTACLVLLLGRWFQSLLYKPGAFQQEFHSLRLSLAQSALILVLMAVSMQVLNGLGFENEMLSEGKMGLVVAPLFSIPIMLAAFALVHALVAIAGVSTHWLGLFYMGMLFVGHLLFLPLMVAALADVVLDIRSRARKSKTPQ